jgi:hypothetical protein
MRKVNDLVVLYAPHSAAHGDAIHEKEGLQELGML